MGAGDLLLEVINQTKRNYDNVELEHRLLLAVSRDLGRMEMSSTFLYREVTAYHDDIGSQFWAATGLTRRTLEAVHRTLEWTTHARNRFGIVLPHLRRILLELNGPDVNVLTSLPNDSTSYARSPRQRLALRDEDDRSRWLDPDYIVLVSDYVRELGDSLDAIATTLETTETTLATTGQELGMILAGSKEHECGVLVDNCTIGARSASNGRDTATRGAAAFRAVAERIVPPSL